jgi:hypothetical protein
VHFLNKRSRRDFYFFKLTQPLRVSVREKGGKPDRKQYPLPYGLRRFLTELQKLGNCGRGSWITGTILE